MKKKVIGIGIMSVIAMVLVLSLAFLVPVSTATAVTGGGQVYIGENATFNLDGGTISGGNAENGGGVYLSSGATMEMTEGEISGNKAVYGGGVYLDGAVMTMTGGKIANNTANYGSAIYLTGSAFLELSGGEINGTIEGDRNGADGNYLLYNDCTFSGGYIDTTGIELAIGSDPTKDIPIKCNLTAGTVVATLDGASATTSLLSHIKVQGLPDDLELKYEGSDIVLAKKVRKVTFSVNNSSYGSVSPSSVEVPSGSTYSVSSNVITFKNNGTTVATVTATPQGQSTQYTYSFNQWYNVTSGAKLATSGTITANMSVRADFTQSLRYYTVSFTASPSGYGSVSPSSVSVPYGTIWTVSGSTLTFSNGSTASVTAVPIDATTQYTYEFSGWSEESGTVIGDTSITANFTQSTRYYTVSLVASPSGYGKVSLSSVSVPYGTKWTGLTSGEIQFSYNGVVIQRPTASPSLNTVDYTYYFDKWSPETGTVSGNITITANFNRIEGTAYTVKFKTSVSSNISLVPDIQPTAVSTPAVPPEFSKSSIKVAKGTTYTIKSSSLIAAAFNLGYTISFGDGQSVTLTWKNATGGSYPITYAFSRWSVNTSGTINSDTTITAYFLRSGMGQVIGDPTEPEQPGIEDIGLGQVIAFIDKRRSLLASVVNQQGSYYREYDICYPI